MQLTENIIFVIKDNEDCQRAVNILEHTTIEDKKDLETAEVYQILKDLIQAWDSKQQHLQKPSGAEMLKAFMESERVTQERLAQSTGMRQANISRILSGKYQISVSSAKKFAAFF